MSCLATCCWNYSSPRKLVSIVFDFFFLIKGSILITNFIGCGEIVLFSLKTLGRELELMNSRDNIGG